MLVAQLYYLLPVIEVVDRCPNYRVGQNQLLLVVQGHNQLFSLGVSLLLRALRSRTSMMVAELYYLR